jgi:hypothetical protein
MLRQPNALDLADAAYARDADRFYAVLSSLFDGMLFRGVSLDHAVSWAQKACLILGMDYLPLL